MEQKKDFDVIIVGGSFAGLAAALALGRGLRSVLVIDSGEPCNKKVQHSQNLLTHDGEAPVEIRKRALADIQKYPTVTITNAFASTAEKKGELFEIRTSSGESYTGRKVLFATGVKNEMLPISGYEECWGVSAIQCPYCHGYEYKGQPTGVLAAGAKTLHITRLINNWTNDLTVFTNGEQPFTDEELAKVKKHNIKIVETPITRLEHNDGHITSIVCGKDSYPISILYTHPPFHQHCALPEALGCELDEMGFIKTDDFKRTTVDSVYAAGDNTTFMRSLSAAIASGNMAGAAINNFMIEEDF